MEKLTRDTIQREALNKFKSLNKLKTVEKGTICLSTGTGKSKIAIDFIKETQNVHKVLITSPRTNLQENWRKELTKWGFELPEHRTDFRWRIITDDGIRYVWIVIENIQTTYKWINEKFDLIIADEIHTMMTPEYSLLFLNNDYKYLMGLTATHDITNKNDKGYYYNEYCPIIYEYYDSADDGLINKTNFIIVNHSLDDSDRIYYTIKGRRDEDGEANYYNYLTERIKSGQKRMMAQGSEDWFADASDWFWKGNGTKEQKFAAMMYLNAIKARKNFLLNLPSTARLAKKIKEGILSIEGNKVLIFSELTAQADKITDNTIHSNNKPIENELLMKAFNDGIVRDLGSCRSLTLGLNLKGATHAIMESYIGSATQSKQKKGRLDRLATDDVAEMWIIRVSGTQAGDSWFEQMTKGFDLSKAEYFDSSIFINNGFDYSKNQIKGS